MRFRTKQMLKLRMHACMHASVIRPTSNHYCRFYSNGWILVAGTTSLIMMISRSETLNKYWMHGRMSHASFNCMVEYYKVFFLISDLFHDASSLLQTCFIDLFYLHVQSASPITHFQMLFCFSESG